MLSHVFEFNICLCPIEFIVKKWMIHVSPAQVIWFFWVVRVRAFRHLMDFLLHGLLAFLLFLYLYCELFILLPQPSHSLICINKDLIFFSCVFFFLFRYRVSICFLEVEFRYVLTSIPTALLRIFIVNSLFQSPVHTIWYHAIKPFFSLWCFEYWISITPSRSFEDYFGSSKSCVILLGLELKFALARCLTLIDL